MAIELTKRAVDIGEEQTLANGIRTEFAAIEHILGASDWREGLKRFDESIGGKGKDRD